MCETYKPWFNAVTDFFAKVTHQKGEHFTVYSMHAVQFKNYLANLQTSTNGTRKRWADQ